MKFIYNGTELSEEAVMDLLEREFDMDWFVDYLNEVGGTVELLGSEYPYGQVCLNADTWAFKEAWSDHIDHLYTLLCETGDCGLEGLTAEAGPGSDGLPCDACIDAIRKACTDDDIGGFLGEYVIATEIMPDHDAVSGYIVTGEYGIVRFVINTAETLIICWTSEGDVKRVYDEAVCDIIDAYLRDAQ